MDNVRALGRLGGYCGCRRLCVLALSWNLRMFCLQCPTFNPLQPMPDLFDPSTVSPLFAVSQLFLQAIQDLSNLLAPGSHMYTYMAESVFGPK